MANDDNPNGAGVGFLARIGPWALIALAAALASVCVWAEEQSNWYLAQGAFIGSLILLALAGADWWRKHRETRVVPPELASLNQALKCLLLAFAIGIIAVLIVSIGKDRWEQGIVARSAGTGILFAGGTFAIGVLFGFLFGFPPTPSSTTPQPPAQNPGNPPQGQPAQDNGAPAAPQSGTSVFQNTNLHEISDWLTKVIVGASLVDLKSLPPQVNKLAQFMATYTDPRNPSPAVALAIMGYFSSCGILFGYVWTRFEFLAGSRPPDPDAGAAK